MATTADKKITDPEVIELIRDAMPEAKAMAKGLMPSSSFMTRDGVVHLDTALKSGIYVAPIETNGTPESDYSLVVVFSTLPYIWQELLTLNTFHRYCRKSIDSGNSWTSWKSISLT